MTREEAQQAWKKMRSEIDNTNWLFVGTINPQIVDIAIEALEADTVEVVRCKDCKWYGNACTFFAADPFEQAPMEKNDFCSYGERSEE